MLSYRTPALLLALWMGSTAAAAPQEGAGSQLALDIAQAAKRQGQTAADTTRALIEGGQAASRAAWAVVSTWRDCNATLDSVGTATFMRPDQVEAIITSVAGVRNCGCSTDAGWARSRLQGRLRPETSIRPVELSDPCACITAAVEAAVGAAPDRSDLVVRAALDAARDLATPLADSMGQRGASPVPGPIAANDVAVYRRKAEVCEADRNDSDAFDPQLEWLPAGNDYSDVGRHQFDCEDDEPRLLLSELFADPGGRSYVEIYNYSDNPVALHQWGYRLSVFYQDVETRGQSIELAGTIAPRDTFIVASQGAPEAALQEANLIVPSLSLASSDTLDLHTGWAGEDCQCAETIVAGSYRGAPPAELEASMPPAALIETKIRRFYGEDGLLTPGYVVDAIGQVEWQEGVQVEILPTTLRRAVGSCRSDANELDAFALGELWQTADEQQWPGGGSRSCDVRRHELVLSHAVADDEQQDAIEIHNPSPAAVDLDAQGYLLEIYEPGNTTPREVVALTGQVPPFAHFLVANPAAADKLQRDPDQSVDPLALQDSSAIVLKRRVGVDGLACRQPIALAMETLEPGVLFFVEDPSSPRPTEDPPELVDPVASPN